MNQQYSWSTKSLPVISKALIKRYGNQGTDFEKLYENLRSNNPDVADWLMQAAENIAPANASRKQSYALLALQLYDMIQEQNDINALSDLYGLAFQPINDISLGKTEKTKS